MKVFKCILLFLFVSMPYIALAFMFGLLFNNTDIEKWIGLTVLMFGIVCFGTFILLPDKKEKEVENDGK